MSSPPDGDATSNPGNNREGKDELPEKPEMPRSIIRWFRGFHLHREKPKITDYLTVGLTLVVAFAAFWSAFIFQGQLSVARQQASDAADDARSSRRHVRQQIALAQIEAKAAQDNVTAVQDQMRLEQRAWMTLSGTRNQIEIGKPIVMGFNLRNTGKTPAKRIYSVFRLEILNDSDEPTFDYSDKELTFWSIDNIEMPNEPTPEIGVTSLSRTPGINTPHAAILSQDLFDKYRNGQIWFATVGKISYEDAFGRTHWLNMCSYKTTARDQSLFSSPVGAKACGKYNDTDD
jgi:hypothetical protein